MNHKQRYLVVAALGVVVLSLLFVPWEETIRRSGTVRTLNFKLSPILPPPTQTGSSTQWRIRTEIIMLEWSALGLVFAGLFVLLKD